MINLDKHPDINGHIVNNYLVRFYNPNDNFRCAGVFSTNLLQIGTNPFDVLQKQYTIEIGISQRVHIEDVEKNNNTTIFNTFSYASLIKDNGDVDPDVMQGKIYSTYQEHICLEVLQTIAIYYRFNDCQNWQTNAETICSLAYNCLTSTDFLIFTSYLILMTGEYALSNNILKKED
jgi:hypothetical protein